MTTTIRTKTDFPPDEGLGAVWTIGRHARGLPELCIVDVVPALKDSKTRAVMCMCFSSSGRRVAICALRRRRAPCSTTPACAPAALHADAFDAAVAARAAELATGFGASAASMRGHATEEVPPKHKAPKTARRPTKYEREYDAPDLPPYKSTSEGRSNRLLEKNGPLESLPMPASADSYKKKRKKTETPTDAPTAAPSVERHCQGNEPGLARPQDACQEGGQ